MITQIKILSFISVPKRILYFIAALLWMLAGFMLIKRGYFEQQNFPGDFLPKFLFSVLSGLIFYVLVFMRLAQKYISRIAALPDVRTPVFNVFTLRSYFVTAVMISLGVTLRKSGIFSPEYLSLFYVIMGTPLVISASRFLRSGITFSKAKQ